MSHALASFSTITRWEILVGLVTGVLAIVGAIWRTGRHLVRTAASLVEKITDGFDVTTANTTAITELSEQVHQFAERLSHLEDRIPGRRR